MAHKAKVSMQHQQKLNQVSTPVVTPAVKPTVTPVVKPTTAPTMTPVVTPAVKPTVTPVVKPTTAPTMTPTVTPVVKPTETPTTAPDVTPVVKPTETPTTAPAVTSTEASATEDSAVTSTEAPTDVSVEDKKAVMEKCTAAINELINKGEIGDSYFINNNADLIASYIDGAEYKDVASLISRNELFQTLTESLDCEKAIDTDAKVTQKTLDACLSDCTVPIFQAIIDQEKVNTAKPITGQTEAVAAKISFIDSCQISTINLKDKTAKYFHDNFANLRLAISDGQAYADQEGLKAQQEDCSQLANDICKEVWSGEDTNPDQSTLDICGSGPTCDCVVYGYFL